MFKNFIFLWQEFFLFLLIVSLYFFNYTLKNMDQEHLVYLIFVNLILILSFFFDPFELELFFLTSCFLSLFIVFLNFCVFFVLFLVNILIKYPKTFFLFTNLIVYILTYSFFLLIIFFYLHVLVLRVSIGLILSVFFLFFVSLIFLLNKIFNKNTNLNWNYFLKKYLPVFLFILFIITIIYLLLFFFTWKFLVLVTLLQILFFDVIKYFYFSYWVPLILNSSLLFNFFRFTGAAPLLLFDFFFVSEPFFSNVFLGILKLEIYDTHLNKLNLVFVRFTNTSASLKGKDIIPVKELTNLNLNNNVEAFNALADKLNLKAFLPKTFVVMRNQYDAMEFGHWVFSNILPENYNKVLIPSLQMFPNSKETVFIIKPNVLNQYSNDLDFFLNKNSFLKLAPFFYYDNILNRWFLHFGKSAVSSDSNLLINDTNIIAKLNSKVQQEIPAKNYCISPLNDVLVLNESSNTVEVSFQYKTIHGKAKPETRFNGYNNAFIQVFDTKTKTMFLSNSAQRADTSIKAFSKEDFLGEIDDKKISNKLYFNSEKVKSIQNDNKSLAATIMAAIDNSDRYNK